MFKGTLISADFEENTMEFEIEHEFTVRAGKYIIQSEADHQSDRDLLTKFAVFMVENIEKVKTPAHLIDEFYKTN